MRFGHTVAAAHSQQCQLARILQFERETTNWIWPLANGLGQRTATEWEYFVVKMKYIKKPIYLFSFQSLGRSVVWHFTYDSGYTMTVVSPLDSFGLVHVWNQKQCVYEMLSSGWRTLPNVMINGIADNLLTNNQQWNLSKICSPKEKTSLPHPHTLIHVRDGTVGGAHPQ